MNQFPLRLGVQQRVLPTYRQPFLDGLAARYERGLGVFAGNPRAGEGLGQAASLAAARHFPAKNIHLFSGRFYMCWQIGLVSWLRTWQPDILIMEANPRYLHSQAALAWMQTRKRPVIGWGLGVPRIGGMADLQRRRFLKQFDALITYSQQGAEEYRQMGLSTERIFVAPNAVSPKPTGPLPERPPAFNDGRANILFVGRLQARKRVDVLLRACAALPDSLQPIVQIVGDGPERENLERFAYQVYPAAQFLGARYGDKLAENFLRADLLVLPGTGGLAVEQAMTYGLPVIAAEADGTQNDLVQPKNGWLIPPGDPEALKNCLQTALLDSERLRQMGGASYQIVSEEVNLEKMIDVFVQVIRSVWEKDHAHITGG